MDLITLFLKNLCGEKNFNFKNVKVITTEFLNFFLAMRNYYFNF